MDTFEAARNELLSELGALRSELIVIHNELVLPGWGSEDRHGFPRTLYGTVMNAMALADRLSCYVAGRTGGSQTNRMREVLESMGATGESAAVAVQLWRHTLMHTGYPLQVINSSTGIAYRWLLHWGPQLPREQHMTVISPAPGDRILNMAAMYLAEDLEVHATALFAQWAEDANKRTMAARVHREIAASQRF